MTTINPKVSLSRIIIFCGVFALTSFSFFQSNDLAESVKRGKDVYEAQCASCHMADGTGLEGVFPPLAKTDRLTDKAKLVKIVLEGMSGPITVNNKDYDLEMSGISLTDEEVRDVLNYVRNSWGNTAAEVKLADVVAAKK